MFYDLMRKMYNSMLLLTGGDLSKYIIIILAVSTHKLPTRQYTHTVMFQLQPHFRFGPDIQEGPMRLQDEQLYYKQNPLKLNS